MKNSQYLFTYIKENRPSSLYIVATFTHVILKLLQINGDSKNTKILIEPKILRLLHFEKIRIFFALLLRVI